MLLELLGFSLEKDETLLTSQTDTWPGFISVEMAIAFKHLLTY